MRGALLIGACMWAGQAFASDGELAVALTACAGVDRGYDAATTDLRNAGWVPADEAAQIRLASAMPISSVLYDHLDGDAQTLRAAHSEGAASFLDTIRKSIEKTEPPFDQMILSVLQSPSGHVAELHWNEIKLDDYSKTYFSCRIAPTAGTDLGGLAQSIEATFTDPYLERQDKSGANGTRSNWNDYDNEHIYLDAIHAGVVEDSQLILINTIVSPES